MKITQDAPRLYKEFVLPTYGWYGVTIERGKGMYLWDERGNRYLDFFPGWAVSSLGHCHRRVVSALKAQADVLLHVPNTYYTALQGALAERIVESSFPGKVFFSNSGAEANEAAVKCARRYGDAQGRYDIITFERSFHGRTLGMIAATGQQKVRDGFGPVLEGFVTVPFNDLAAVEDAITPKTVGIMLEPIQGEGGVNIAAPDFLEGLKQLAEKHDLLLIYDEVQTGMGRTGKLFGYQLAGVEPDIMALAKALGGGFPIGATVVKDKVAEKLSPGAHGSTFGGNPLACACGLAVFEAIEKDHILENVAKMGGYLKKRLDALKTAFPELISDLRGAGLMWGVELTVDGNPIFSRCLEKGLIINCTQKNVLRLLPALTVTGAQVDEAVNILTEVLKEGC
ncbi:MAG: aspartate aminotransferase family protein [Candidatus Omnitrophica bacterium]|nr:aspartate aminotransferase family protein [Candidatus Omnitrophota bacterium]